MLQVVKGFQLATCNAKQSNPIHLPHLFSFLFYICFMKRTLLLLLIMGVHALVSSQTNWDNVGIEVRPKVGFLLPHRAVMTHLLTGHSVGGELGFVKQTSGKKEWEEAYRLPRYGASLYFADYGNPLVVGQSLGAFGFIELPMVKYHSWSLNGKLTAGVGVVTKKFDLVENPKNNAIGSHTNALVIIGVNVNKQFKQSTVSLGIDMTHLSNGATVLPNLGLNVPYLSLGYTRYFNPLLVEQGVIRPDVLQFTRHALLTSALFSMKQIYPTGGRTYFVGSGSVIYHHQFRRKVALDFAIDFISNQSHADEISEPVSQWDIFQLGLYVGYVLPVNQFDYLLGMGYYMKNSINPNGPVYHRFGFRYRFRENMFFNLNIKAHWGKADYFEYGIVYQWR